MPVSNPAAALGEAVGKLIEKRITGAITLAVAARGYIAGPKRLVNGSGNTYQIDCVVAAQDGSPVIIVDPKYIRYKKHNRDKGSWLCVAHYNLRKSHPTIRKSVAILSGRWSKPSVEMIKSFGIEVHELPFELIAERLSSQGIPFEWDEKDRTTPREAWDNFQKVSEEDRWKIADEICGKTCGIVTNSILETLSADMSTMQKRVREVEILLKTTHDELFLSAYPNVAEAAQYLLGLLTDRTDVTDHLK